MAVKPGECVPLEVCGALVEEVIRESLTGRFFKGTVEEALARLAARSSSFGLTWLRRRTEHGVIPPAVLALINGKTGEIWTAWLGGPGGHPRRPGSEMFQHLGRAGGPE